MSAATDLIGTTLSARAGVSGASAQGVSGQPDAEADQAVAQTSAIVTLSGTEPGDPPLTYPPPDTSLPSATVTWAVNSRDAVTTLMGRNYQAVSLADRFRGLGSALLSRFQTDASDFSQAVNVTYPAGAAGAVSAVGQVASNVKAEMSLTVKTASGVTVKLTLSSGKDGLSVNMESSGKLSTAERKALASLSGAFQNAVDGLSAKTPKLDLSGLTQFDTSALSSVDLKSDVTIGKQATQSVVFHADSAARTLTVTNATGTMTVNVDLGNPAIRGSQAQQTDAIASYLKQIDQAGARGRGDKALTAMFKDAFSQMNSNIGEPSQLVLPGALSPNDSDHAMMTGLADFSASVTQTAQVVNPTRTTEQDYFSYDVSQSTSVTGTSELDRGISQRQDSNLSAAYHRALYADVPVSLGSSRASQNYYYEQIDDSASSAASIAYQDGRLASASVDQSASQSRREMKYEMGRLVEDNTTPYQSAYKQDLLALIKPFLQNGAPADQIDTAQWRNALSDVHDRITLASSPTDLAARQKAADAA